MRNPIEITGNFTELKTKYKNIVKCKPTLGNPLTQRSLIFEIDDAANYPLNFRTYHGDSVQNFFLLTPDKTVKVIGTHNPGGNYFSVENLAYPPTRAFTDNLILKDALEEMYKGYVMTIHQQEKNMLESL